MSPYLFLFHSFCIAFSKDFEVAAFLCIAFEACLWMLLWLESGAGYRFYFPLLQYRHNAESLRLVCGTRLQQAKYCGLSGLILPIEKKVVTLQVKIKPHNYDRRRI